MKKESILIIAIILLLISNGFFIFYSFKDKEENENVVELLTKKTQSEIDDMTRRAINNGDTTAYKKLSVSFRMNYKWYELFYYSFIMANKYNNHDAFRDLYSILSAKMMRNGVNMYSSDEITQSYAKYFLLKSYELGNKHVIYDIEQEFGEENEFPKSSFYLYKIAGDSLTSEVYKKQK